MSISKTVADSFRGGTMSLDELAVTFLDVPKGDGNKRKIVKDSEVFGYEFRITHDTRTYGGNGIRSAWKEVAEDKIKRKPYKDAAAVANAELEKRGTKSKGYWTGKERPSQLTLSARAGTLPLSEVVYNMLSTPAGRRTSAGTGKMLTLLSDLSVFLRYQRILSGSEKNYDGIKAQQEWAKMDADEREPYHQAAADGNKELERLGRKVVNPNKGKKRSLTGCSLYTREKCSEHRQQHGGKGPKPADLYQIRRDWNSLSVVAQEKYNQAAKLEQQEREGQAEMEDDEPPSKKAKVLHFSARDLFASEWAAYCREHKIHYELDEAHGAYDLLDKTEKDKLRERAGNIRNQLNAEAAQQDFDDAEGDSE